MQKRLRRNSPTQTRSVSNGSEADMSESIVDTCNTRGLTSPQMVNQAHLMMMTLI